MWAACDPLYAACAGNHGQSSNPGESSSVSAPAESGEGEPAVGHARTPNLRATVAATWRNGTIRVTVRVLTTKPRLVNRWFLVRVRIPALDETALVRVRATGKRVRTLQLTFAGPSSAIGKYVTVASGPSTT